MNEMGTEFRQHLRKSYSRKQVKKTEEERKTKKEDGRCRRKRKKMKKKSAEKQGHKDRISHHY